MNNEPNQDVNPANVGMTPIRLAQEKSRIESGLGGLPIPKPEVVEVIVEDFTNPNLITSKNVLELTAPEMKLSEEEIKPEAFTSLTPDELNMESSPSIETPTTTPPTTTTPETTTPYTIPTTTTPPTTTEITIPPTTIPTTTTYQPTKDIPPTTTPSTNV